MHTHVHTREHTHNTRRKPSSLVHQPGQVLVGHSPDALVDVVEVHQQELRMALQLLLVLLGLGLDSEETGCRPCTAPAGVHWHSNKAYFICHHVQEGIKHLVGNGDHTLQHPCNRRAGHQQRGPPSHLSLIQHSPKLSALFAFPPMAPFLSRDPVQGTPWHPLSTALSPVVCADSLGFPVFLSSPLLKGTGIL